MALFKNSSVRNSSSGLNPKKSFWTPGRVVLTLVALGLVGALGLSSCNSRDGSSTNAPANGAANVPRPTKPAPPVAPVSLPSEVRDLTLKTLDGGSLKLSDFKDKVVVLNIWATWCGPCRLEMPELVKISDEYKTRGVVVLGVATTYNEQDDPIHVKEFIRSQNIPYRIIWDDGTMVRPLMQAVQARPVIPQSFVISRDGHIVKHFSGYDRVNTPGYMRKAIEDAERQRQSLNQ